MGSFSVRVCVCVSARRVSACVCVNQCGQMRPKQSCTVKGVNGGGAVRGIGMEIKITWHSDSISVRAAAAEGPLTIQIHTVKLVRWRERKRPAQTPCLRLLLLDGEKDAFIRGGTLGLPVVREKPCK